MRPHLLSLSVRWVACLFALGCLAQSRIPSAPTLNRLSADDAHVFLTGFRHAHLKGDLCLHVEIIHKPRQGDSLAPVKGTLWVSSVNGAQLLRGEIQNAQGQLALSFLSIKSSAETLLWVSRRGAQASQLEDKSPLVPLADGLILSPFDLQLPFTHWADTSYANTERRRRPVHVFDAKNLPGREPARVNFAIDSVYAALIQANCFDSEGNRSRTLTVEEFSKVEEQWMLAVCSVRDEKTRDSDILRITEAAPGERFKSDIFAPETLTQPAAQPAHFQKL